MQDSSEISPSNMHHYFIDAISFNNPDAYMYLLRHSDQGFKTGI